MSASCAYGFEHSSGRVRSLKATASCVALRLLTLPGERYPNRSHVETLSASAFALGFRILKLEGLIQALFDKIHQGPVDQRQTQGVHHDFHAARFEYRIFGMNFISIIHDIRESRATGLLDPDAQAQTGSALCRRHRKALAQILHSLRQRGAGHGAPRSVLGNPCRHRDRMRAAESQKPRRLDDSPADLHVELHPGPLLAPAGGAAVNIGTGEDPRTRSGLEVVQGQFVVFHTPLIPRILDTARETTATAVSRSLSRVPRPRPNRRLLSLNASSRPNARST